jgi:hypothetical protein
MTSRKQGRIFRKDIKEGHQGRKDGRSDGRKEGRS